MSKLIPIDILDPVDIAMMTDPEVEQMVQHIEDNEDDYDTLFAGISIKESEQDDDNDTSTFNTIDDNSTDPLDMEADDIIDSYEDNDDDGELIDMIMNGYNI
jgi:hypothetical protein